MEFTSFASGNWDFRMEIYRIGLAVQWLYFILLESKTHHLEASYCYQWWTAALL